MTELESLGHHVVAPNLPCDDDSAGLAEYAEIVIPEPFDPVEVFCHDLPCGLTAEAGDHARGQSSTPFEKPWPLAAWPNVPTRFLLCRDDRFFPAGFQRRVVAERLGIEPDEMDGGHLPALGHPRELVQRLEAYRGQVIGTREQ